MKVTIQRDDRQIPEGDLDLPSLDISLDEARNAIIDSPEIGSLNAKEHPFHFVVRRKSGMVPITEPEEKALKVVNAIDNKVLYVRSSSGSYDLAKGTSLDPSSLRKKSLIIQARDRRSSSIPALSSTFGDNDEDLDPLLQVLRDIQIARKHPSVEEGSEVAKLLDKSILNLKIANKPNSVAVRSRLELAMQRRLSVMSAASDEESEVANWLRDQYMRKKRPSKFHSLLKKLPSLNLQRSPTADPTSSLADIVDRLMPTLNEAKINSILKDINCWGFKVLEFEELTEGRALSTLFIRLVQKHGLGDALNLSPSALYSFIRNIESRYQANPYHNKTHAADVLQNVHYFISANKDVYSSLEKVDILAALVAAAVHDVDHPGLTNPYLVATSDELALTYNDRSVLENYHAATAFRVLQEDECNFVGHLGESERQSFRHSVIQMVLGTDMSKHVKHLSEFNHMMEEKQTDGGEALKDGDEKIHFLRMAVHCGDLSNPAKPIEQSRKWVDMLMQEFYQQGDREREANLPISAMMDRKKPSIEKSQVGFIQFLIKPLFEKWADFIPEFQEILTVLDSNLLYWQEAAAKITSDSPKLARKQNH